METLHSILSLMGSRPGWDLLIETGDALISRSRSIAVSRWLREMPTTDAFLMTDDDFQFTPEAAEAVVALAREKRGIAAGVTPLRSGEFTAIVPLHMTEDEPWTDPEAAPREIRWAGGFLGYHRDVFEKLATILPLLHENEPTIPAFYPFFLPMMAEVENRLVYLSEDYACHARAKAQGFSIWVQPKAQVGHLAQTMVTAENMATIRDLVH